MATKTDGMAELSTAARRVGGEVKADTLLSALDDRRREILAEKHENRVPFTLAGYVGADRVWIRGRRTHTDGEEGYRVSASVSYDERRADDDWTVDDITLTVHKR